MLSLAPTVSMGYAPTTLPVMQPRAVKMSEVRGRNATFPLALRRTHE